MWTAAMVGEATVRLRRKQGQRGWRWETLPPWSAFPLQLFHVQGRELVHLWRFRGVMVEHAWLTRGRRIVARAEVIFRGKDVLDIRCIAVGSRISVIAYIANS